MNIRQRTKTVEHLAAQLDEMAQEHARQVAELRQESMDLRAHVASLEALRAAGSPAIGAQETALTNRRGLLRTAMGAAAATIGAGALFEAQPGTASATGPVVGTDVGAGYGVKGESNDSPQLHTVFTRHQIVGVWGNAPHGDGVSGTSASGTGVVGQSKTSTPAHPTVGEGPTYDRYGFLAGKDAMFAQDTGVYGESAQQGVFGHSTGAKGTGVYGNGFYALRGDSPHATGFVGGIDPQFKQHAGVWGSSDQQGVFGRSIGTGGTGVYGNGFYALRGDSPNGTGFVGGIDPEFKQHAGVWGSSDQQGVFGTSSGGHGTGVYGNSTDGHAIRGETNSGIAVQGQALATGGLAGKFIGVVEVTGDIRLTNQDCAEDFDVSDAEEIEPGTVMVIDKNGALRISQQAYDSRVAGVVSGAGDLKPGIVLGKLQSLDKRMPIALLGKVYCKVDASSSPIDVGDILTTSPRSGHAMKAVDPMHAFGAIIGKALRPLEGGQGLIPILVALQ